MYNVKNLNFDGKGKYNILRIYTELGQITIYPNCLNGKGQKVDIVKIHPFLTDEYKVKFDGSYYNQIVKGDRA